MLLIFVIFVSFGAPATQIKKDKLQVVASFYPLYYFSERIGGEKAEVINIMPAGVEPHEYELSARDMVLIEKAGLLVLNGGGLEAWGSKIKENMTGEYPVVVAGEGLTNEEEIVADPHYWLSPSLAQKMTDNILDGFILADPSNKDYFQANADSLKVDLAELNAAYQNELSVCAERNMVTAHDAFGYLAKRYGLNQISISGLSPVEEPSSRRLTEIAKFTKDNDIKYIFFESLVSRKFSETIANEVGAKTLVLNPLEGLTQSELEQKKNYFTVMRNNLENLKIALQCKK